ncbi:hypothetical protein FOC1_g10015896 [Fusarium oxysporum f. sp. cubense race 1]|uniref:Uncharacterized protein n=1 Tax=Fusarium oxysporum f. sp. cubense (strain race 1) TaxID=1229664 RepID=N4TU00_FUSC1|nr:hypothetical protein FOC1_g10015896 [Fusarium oxysporum f. sp. cubense race 1]
MTAFFVDWDLWQEMTFVLGCCIVLVFAMGLMKLWWSNRAIRRLEIIDEEKRARISLMSRCGIENMRAPGIPFGVRAILSGVEVEGIWISRPNSPGPCQLTPVATQINCNHTGSRSSSSCNDDFITPEQTPPGSTKAVDGKRGNAKRAPQSPQIREKAIDIRIVEQLANYHEFLQVPNCFDCH